MKNKLKNNSGSAMILAIFSILIVSSLGIYITNQIGNQLKSSRSTYEYNRTAYLAESSMERTIYDIENQIYSGDSDKILDNRTKTNLRSWVSVNHSEHEDTKVKYNNDVMDASSFEKLVYNELIENGNNSKDSIRTLMTDVVSDIGTILEDNKMKDSLQTNISMTRYYGEYIKQQWNVEGYFDIFVTYLKDTLNQLETARELYMQRDPNPIEALDKVKRLIGVLEEILCRLNLLDIKNKVTKSIDLKLYETVIDLDDKNKVDTKTSSQIKDIKIYIEYDGNKIEDIDFDNLNKVLSENNIYGRGVLKKKNQLIEEINRIYKINFEFNSGKVNHNITYIENE